MAHPPDSLEPRDHAQRVVDQWASVRPDLDASPILEYFAPLQGWLTEQNKGQSCGW